MKIRVFKITSPLTGSVYYTNAPLQVDLDECPVGTKIEVTEMTREEYQAIPATQDTANFFAR